MALRVANVGVRVQIETVNCGSGVLKRKMRRGYGIALFDLVAKKEAGFLDRHACPRRSHYDADHGWVTSSTSNLKPSNSPRPSVTVSSGNLSLEAVCLYI